MNELVVCWMSNPEPGGARFVYVTTIKGGRETCAATAIKVFTWKPQARDKIPPAKKPSLNRRSSENGN